MSIHDINASKNINDMELVQVNLNSDFVYTSEYIIIYKTKRRANTLKSQ